MRGKWSVANLNDLVAERSSRILSLGDFGAITEFFSPLLYLRSKNRLSQEDRVRKFLEGLHPELRDRVLQRLQYCYLRTILMILCLERHGIRGTLCPQVLQQLFA